MNSTPTPFPANLGWAIGGTVTLPGVLLAALTNTTSPELEWKEIAILTVWGTCGTAIGAGLSARWQRKGKEPGAVSPTKYALTWMGAFLVAWTVFLIWPYVAGDRHYSQFFGRVLVNRSVSLFVLSLALFGMLGGMGTTLWGRQPRPQPQVLSVLVMGVVGSMSVVIASAVSVVGLYLSVGTLSAVLQQLGEPFASLSLAPSLVCAAIAGAVGGAIGGTIGEGVASAVLDGKHDLLGPW